MPKHYEPPTVSNSQSTVIIDTPQGKIFEVRYITIDTTSDWRKVVRDLSIVFKYDKSKNEGLETNCNLPGILKFPMHTILPLPHGEQPLHLQPSRKFNGKLEITVEEE